MLEQNEKLEVFADLFHTMLKMHPEMKEAVKINNFYSRLRKRALQTLKNITVPNKKTPEDVLMVFQRKHFQP